MFHCLVFLVLLQLTAGLFSYPPDKEVISTVSVNVRDIHNIDFATKVISIEGKINEIIKRAESVNGIAFGVLKSEARALKELAQYILSQQKANVSEEEIKKAINEASSLTNVGTIVVPNINDPMSYEARSLNVTLLVLQQLGKKLVSQQVSEENYEATLAAISQNCDYIIDILEISEDFAVVLIRHEQKHISRLRRQYVGGFNAGYSRGNGFGASAGLQYSRGNFQVGANVGWNQGQGLNVGVGASWRFGRR